MWYFQTCERSQVKFNWFYPYGDLNTETVAIKLSNISILFLITSRKRSLGQGNMFAGVCLSTGGVPGPGGWSALGGCAWSGGFCSGGA